MWTALIQHEKHVRTRRFQTLFDSQRAVEFSASADGLLFDYSKTNIDADIKTDLIALAESAGWAKARDAMMSGQKINVTENRAVLHTALRASHGQVTVDGIDVMPGVLDSRERMLSFAQAVRSGDIKGAGGAYTDVVNIGIGGSDLGPAMAVLALAPYGDGPNCHFVSNIDGAHVSDVLKGLNPSTTLVIVASKTFTTIETMTNARSALDWMAQSLDRPADQFVALSTDLEKTAAFGIDDARVFGFEDWVGGRYSLWGPIGLSIALAIGPDDFRSFLDGGASMDAHFATSPAADNLPVMLALVGIWHRQICGYPTRAVLPYEQRLARFPAYLQQLEMESNGKRVTLSGDAPEVSTGPVVWGEPGTNGQHAFYQLIHQGTEVIPCEFMIAKEGHEPHLAHHHRLLQANCLAQSEALMLGRDFDTAKTIAAQAGYTGAERGRQAAHRVFPGNRPSTTLCYPKLTPFVLGQLIALYEHRVFVEGVILGINSFDQWGVELGKILATDLLPLIEGQGERSTKDGSTQALLEYLS